jgi:hypothetical protein
VVPHSEQTCWTTTRATRVSVAAASDGIRAETAPW